MPRFDRKRKSGAVAVGLASTLILALAIAKPSFQLPVQVSESVIATPVDGAVKRLEVRLGDTVLQGTDLIVLTDPSLEKQIQEAEITLAQARASDLTAIAEPGMLGSIGSAARTIWETAPTVGKVVHEVAAKTSPLKTPGNSGTDIANAKTKISDITRLIATKETSLQEAEANLAASESVIQDTTERASSMAKERDRHQRLYDMGAIAKRKLDDVLSAATQAEVEVKAAIATAEDRKVQRDQIQKERLDAKADLREAEVTLESLQLEANRSIQTPIAAESVKLVLPKRELPKQRIVFGTSPESLAPISVKLVDSGDSKKDATITQLMERVQLLRNRRAKGIVKSSVNGRITWIAPVGAQLKAGEVVVRIEQPR